MKRRQFVTLSAATAGALFLPKCVATQSLAQRSVEKSAEKYTSLDGLLEVNLDARFGAVALGGGANLYSYNGQIPGPKLEVKPGDTVRIRFTNNLSEPTNLHYHGLHIPPTGSADNVFLDIPPGETFTYEFTIPKNHPAGTFWYHPHRHGLVAKQVFAGLAGLFIVRGELDNIPEVAAATEHFLVLKDFYMAGNSRNRVNHHGLETGILDHRDRMLGREGPLITVNGERQPKFSIPAGGLLRLRLLNASASRFYLLQLEDHPVYLIATDGGAIAEPVELRELMLTPGERAEVLIRGERPPGEYRLLNLPYNRGVVMGGMMGGGMMGGGMMDGGMMGRRFENTQPEAIATLTYQRPTENIDPLPLPNRLSTVAELPEPQTVRRFILNHGMVPGQGMVFLINGQTFDHHRVDTEVKLNHVEDWELLNTGVMDHPFHLHTNPFQIIARNGSPPAYRAWKDTVLVYRGELVRIRVPFQDFIGKTVYHCHILDHEDLGMMGMMEMKA